MDDNGRKKNRIKVSFQRLLYLIVLFACVGWLFYAHVRSLNSEPVNTFIPVSFHASTSADYRAGEGEAWWFTVEVDLLEEAIFDPSPGSDQITPHSTDIESVFAAPVPTVTPVSLWSGLSE
jgi:hypothetical protein